MSTIENSAEGDAIQFMVSTNGKIICGKNRGSGWRTRQVGGYMSNTSLQRLSQDILGYKQQNLISSHYQRDPLAGSDKAGKNHSIPDLANVTPQYTPSPTSS